MCGILGIMATKHLSLTTNYIRCINDLFVLSESRGKEASGVCFVTDDSVNILKSPTRARMLINSTEYKRLVKKNKGHNGILVMGHARMVTNGSAKEEGNNQPVVKGDLVCIHNGIITNSEELWAHDLNSIERQYEVDTEAFLALLYKYNYKSNILYAFSESLKRIEGSLSIALIDRKSDWLVLYTNTGSLYCACSKESDDILFSSERCILEKAIIKSGESRRFSILPVKPGQGYLFDLSTGKRIRFRKSDNPNNLVTKSQGEKDRRLTSNSLNYNKNNKIRTHSHFVNTNQVQNLLEIDIEKIHRLRRCTKCLLPETFPGITFDPKGVCSVCREYKKIEPKGQKALKKELDLRKSIGSRYDCIAPISGGRDSCYILHYLVKELKLKPVAYTYDWGLVTDLARRNIQRLCASLGVEHILISADIAQKRENVRKNVEAWLKRPSLGTVPLFMAGDKQFFYYAQLLKKQMHVDSVVFGMNRLEETKFKARFIGLGNTSNQNDSFQHFSTLNKFGMLANYGKEFAQNPAYINQSLADSFVGFLSYYAVPQNYIRFFDYIPWDEKMIINTLRGEYNWEVAGDSEETWRIGDGTAPFYNYIYYRLAGFTEFDTFRSNQIREGMITREEALKTIDQSNRTPIEGFLWYCNTIGLDPIRTIKVINSQKPLYEKVGS